MGAGERDLERTAGRDKPAHVREVDDRVLLGRRRRGSSDAIVVPGDRRPRQGGRRGTSRPPDPDDRRRLRHRADGDGLDPGRERRFRPRLGRDDHPPHAASRERDRHRQDARDAADLAAEAELPDQPDAVLTRAELLGSQEDAEGDRQVERRAGLAQLGGREVDRDAAWWMVEARVAQRPAHTLPRLRQRGVRQPDDREPGQARGDVHLDADDPAGDADERGGQEGCEHERHGSRGHSPPAYREPPRRRRARAGTSAVSAPRRAPAAGPACPRPDRSPGRSPARSARARSRPCRP